VFDRPISRAKWQIPNKKAAQTCAAPGNTRPTAAIRA
jgi:hypothetical protein